MPIGERLVFEARQAKLVPKKNVCWGFEGAAEWVAAVVIGAAADTIEEGENPRYRLVDSKLTRPWLSW